MTYFHKMASSTGHSIYDTRLSICHNNVWWKSICLYRKPAVVEATDQRKTNHHCSVDNSHHHRRDNPLHNHRDVVPKKESGNEVWVFDIFKCYIQSACKKKLLLYAILICLTVKIFFVSTNIVFTNNIILSDNNTLEMEEREK